MKLKVVPICPACRSPHDTEVEPGVKVTCPDCEQVYRAELPEPADATARPQGRAPSGKPAGKAAPARSEKPGKKPRTRKADKLGKVIERFAATRKRAILLTGAIAAVVVGVGIAIFSLVGTQPDVRPFVLGGSGGLFLVALLCFLRLRFGPTNALFVVCKNGVRYQTRRTEQYLFWEEMEDIDINREIHGPNDVRYEITLVGSETIHLTQTFLATLDDPLGLIKAIKKHSGKDFQTAIG